MEDALDVMLLVNQVASATKNVRDHRNMVAQLAGRINALQSLILSLVEDAGQACPPEFLERLQEELEAAATAIKRCTRSAGYRDRYFDDITLDLKDVNFRIVSWLGDMRAHMVSAGMLEGRDSTHNQSRARRILKEIRESQERFEDFGSFGDAEAKDSRGDSISIDGRKESGSRRPSMETRPRARRSTDTRRKGSINGSDYARSRGNSIERRSRGSSFDSEEGRREHRARSLWSESVLEEEAKIEELRRRARAELGDMNRAPGEGRRGAKRSSGEYYPGESLESGEFYPGGQSLGNGNGILAPPEAVDFHDEVDRVLLALENTGDMDRVIQQIIETQTLGERERDFLIEKTEKLKRERAPQKGPVFGDVGASPWAEGADGIELSPNRARPGEDTEQQLLRDVEEARKSAREFRSGNKPYTDTGEELIGADRGYLPQTIKTEAAVAVVEITTALAAADKDSGGEAQVWSFSPSPESMGTIHEGGLPDEAFRNPLTETVSAALLAAGNDSIPTQRRSSGNSNRPKIIPMDTRKAARLRRTRSNEPTTLEDDITAALAAREERQGSENPGANNAPPGVIAIGAKGPVAIGAKVGGITGWPAGLLRAAAPSAAARTNPEALLKDKQREEASVMEKVYKALKAVKIGEIIPAEKLLAPDGKVGAAFCQLPTGPRVLRKNTKEVKEEILSFMDEINWALESARAGPPLGSETLSREPPEQFVCPLSGGLMRDPVLLIHTEQNYERAFIERWFARGHRVCPATGVAVHTTTTLRNHKLRQQIRDWAKLEEISPRVELVQPRADIPLSSTPKVSTRGANVGGANAPSSSSLNGHSDDVPFDLALHESVEESRAKAPAAERPVEVIGGSGDDLRNGNGGVNSEIVEEASFEDGVASVQSVGDTRTEYATDKSAGDAGIMTSAINYVTSALQV